MAAETPGDRWARAIEESLLVAGYRRARDELDAAGEALAAGAERSIAGRAIEQVSSRAEAAAEASLLAALLRTLGDWARASFLWRWLTTEPEPEVIVIDLRETWTVGPVIATLDRVVGALAPAVRSSRVAAWGEATGDAVRDAPIRTASLVVLAATLANLGATTLAGSVTESGLLLRLAVLAAALAGTRVTTPLEDLRESRAWRLLVGLLEPPEPPADREEPRERE